MVCSGNRSAASSGSGAAFDFDKLRAKFVRSVASSGNGSAAPSGSGAALSVAELRAAIASLMSEKMFNELQRHTNGSGRTDKAAARPTKCAKDFPETFALYLELAIKGSKWCAQIVSSNTTERFSQRELPVGGLPEIEPTVLRLNTIIFDTVSEAYVSRAREFLEEPFALNLESVILASFELIKAIYSSKTVRNPFPQSESDEAMRKHSQELLTSIYRIVHIFRKQIGNDFPIAINDSQSMSSPETRWQNLPTALRLVASSVNSFTELGKLSTSGGDIIFALLALSWKTTIALLQVEEGREPVASALDIPSMIANLTSNAVEALKRAVDTWLLPSTDAIEKDARRLCIPIKFFLVTAMKIAAVYPLKAILVSRTIVSCVTKVYACLLLPKIAVAQKAAAEALAEMVVPSAFSILHNLFGSQDVSTDSKIGILKAIEGDGDDLESSQVADLAGCHDGNATVDELFSNKPAAGAEAGLLETGSVVLYLSVLQVSSAYNVDLISKFLCNLSWLLDEIEESQMYMLMSQNVYLPNKYSNMSGKWSSQLMFSWVSNALQAFAMVVAKHEIVVVELKHFLLEQFLHPNLICGELVLDLWCFVARQSDPSQVQDDVESVLSLIQDCPHDEVTLKRRLARVLCCLLQVAPQKASVRVHDVIFGKLQCSLATVLIQEGFSFSLLDASQRTAKNGRVLCTCIAQVRMLVDGLKAQGGNLSEPDKQKETITCLLMLLSERAHRGEPVEDGYLQMIKHIIESLMSMYTREYTDREYTSSVTIHSLGILGPVLELIPHVQHLLDPKLVHVFLPKVNELYQSYTKSEQSELKQPLAGFLATLSEIPIPEDEGNPVTKALRGMFHIVLREKHWALTHSGLQSLSQFAANSSFQELWRFVPLDAGVVCDGHTDDDAFMKAMNNFIKKEGASSSLTTTDEELERLRAECTLLQKRREEHNDMETDPVSGGLTETICTKEITEAVAMMNKAIRVLHKKVPEWLRQISSQTALEWSNIRAQLAELTTEVNVLRGLQG